MWGWASRFHWDYLKNKTKYLPRICGRASSRSSKYTATLASKILTGGQPPKRSLNACTLHYTLINLTLRELGLVVYESADVIYIGKQRFRSFATQQAQAAQADGQQEQWHQNRKHQGRKLQIAGLPMLDLACSQNWVELPVAKIFACSIANKLAVNLLRYFRAL